MQQRARSVFYELDENNSGTLDMDEIKGHLERSMGDDYNENIFNE